MVKYDNWYSKGIYNELIKNTRTYKPPEPSRIKEWTSPNMDSFHRSHTKLPFDVFDEFMTIAFLMGVEQDQPRNSNLYKLVKQPGERQLCSLLYIEFKEQFVFNKNALLTDIFNNTIWANKAATTYTQPHKQVVMTVQLETRWPVPLERYPELYAIRDVVEANAAEFKFHRDLTPTDDCSGFEFDAYRMKNPHEVWAMLVKWLEL